MQNTGFLEELRWRNMLQDYTPGLEAYLAEGVRSAYIGFDPTAKSLGLGNYVQIMLLTHFQRAGHRPIVLMGGATGRIGDPSGKDQERELKSYEELEENIRFQAEQLKTLLVADESGQSVAYVNNYDFYKGMNVLDFLRDVGKHTTINYMLSKESVKKRLETGISFTEFSYQLLQAYDFYCLYKQHDCRIQMGGSDQWGNITAGTEYIGKTIADAKAYAVTTPLLTKADGKKFGKSEAGNIWLDPKMTSPYKFYQFWINCDDGMLDKLFRYFSLKPRTEIEQLLEQAETHPRELKKVLAEEITLRIHGESSLKQVMSVSELMFNKDCTSEFLFGMELDALIQVGEELPRFSVGRDQFFGDANVIQLLSGHTSILASKSEARRSIQGNAISINKRKISNPEETLGESDLIRDRFILVENGKKNKYFVELTSS